MRMLSTENWYSLSSSFSDLKVRSRGGLAVINPDSGPMSAVFQSISFSLRGFFSGHGYSGFPPSAKSTLSELHPASGGYLRYG